MENKRKISTATLTKSEKYSLGKDFVYGRLLCFC